MGRIKQETVSGVKWNLIQKCTQQPVQFIYAMILARLISPEEMGILGLTSVFFAIASQLQNCGFGAALVRKQDRTDEDCSTVFWFNVGMSALLSLALFLAAPWFASFYDQPALLNLTRASAVLMFLASTTSVHYTLFSARRDFRTLALVGMVCTLVPMPMTIWAAYCGWSYWSLIVQSGLSGVLSLVLIWCISPWKPRLVWSWSAFREFFGFGSKLAVSGLVTMSYTQSRVFIIGKFYSPQELALFTRAFHLCELPQQLILSTMSNISYPILATLRDQPEELVRYYRKYIRLVLMPVLGMMVTLAASAHSIVEFLYGSKWLGCAGFLQVLVIGIAFNPLTNLCCVLLSVFGRSDYILQQEVVVRCVALSLLVLAAFHSVYAVCWVAAFVGFFTAACSVYNTYRASGLSIRSQLGDFVPYLLWACLCNVPAIVVDTCALNIPYYVLAVCMPGGALLAYVAILYLRRDDALFQYISLLKESRLGKLLFAKFAK